MAYQEPRVPVPRDGGRLMDYMNELCRFLRGFTQAAWNADRINDTEIEKIKQRLEQLEGGK